MKFSAVVAALMATAAAATSDSTTSAFNEFIAKYEKEYTPAEYTERRAIFAQRLAAVERHNSQKKVSHVMGINHLSAHTDMELARLRGFGGFGGTGGGGPPLRRKPPKQASFRTGEGRAAPTPPPTSPPTLPHSSLPIG